MTFIHKMEAVEALLASVASPSFVILNDATETLDALRDELVTLVDQSKNLQAKADGEKRALTPEEQTEMDAIFARFEAVEDEIERRERIAANEARLAQPAGRKTEPNDVAAAAASERPARTRVAATVKDHGDLARHGFRSFGEYAQAVKAGSAKAASIDPRLIANAPTTTSTEGVGADGGFAVPPEFRTAIYQKVMGEDGLLSRTDQLTSSSNSITVPKDETTAWQTSGGLQANWDGEAALISQSKVALEETTIRLNKLTALVPVTEELLADASSLATYINRKVPEKFAFKINDAIVNGTGAGQPKGILNAESLVTVSKESGQAADTLVFQNIVNMYSRVYSGCRANLVWLINQDIEPQLYSMAFPGTGTAVPVYLPPGGLSGAPYGTLMGRPVIPTQACDTLGDVGDIIAVDLSKYMTAVKTGGIRSDVSMHLWFDYDVSAFRFIMRLAGQPWWTAAITPKNSLATLSWAVALEAR